MPVSNIFSLAKRFNLSGLNSPPLAALKENPPLSIIPRPLATGLFIVKNNIPSFIQNKSALRNTLKHLEVYRSGQYLHDHFTHWLSDYAKSEPAPLQSYFSGNLELNAVCQDFIKFCFYKNIFLDKEKTLQSFEQHNRISDDAFKKELATLKKEKINLLGFGLGDGYYEKSIADYLVKQGLAQSVKIYGFDPFAEKMEDIQLLTKEMIVASNKPVFDVIIARWVLHHVDLKDRWLDFINCINASAPDSLVLIVEHGLLQNNRSLPDKKLYQLLNATFDVVANIGIRPHWFTSTMPDIGANFFIHYLEPEDLLHIKNKASIQLTQNIFEVGPNFPNQTICCMRPKL